MQLSHQVLTDGEYPALTENTLVHEIINMGVTNWSATNEMFSLAYIFVPGMKSPCNEGSMETTKPSYNVSRLKKKKLQ